MQKVISFWKTIAWSVFMIVVFLLPADNLSKAPSIPFFPVLVHVFLFFVFTWFYTRDQLKHKSMNRPSINIYVIAALLSFLFGALIEILQEASGLGRNAEFIDVVCDIGGSLLSIQVIILLNWVRRNRAVKD